MSIETYQSVDELIDEHMPLADRIASQFMFQRPWFFGMADEIRAAALRGLWEAARKFDPSRGFKFETYAIHRIRGHIIDWTRDELGRRKTDGTSRRVKVVDYDVLRVGDQREALREIMARDTFEASISMLNAREKQMVRLRVRGYTMNEIAERVGVSESRISQQFKEIFAKMRQWSGADEVRYDK